jgi:hypothetical protein
LLDETALNMVLAHDAHHARRRDPLPLAVGRVLARALFFVPGLDEPVRRQQGLAQLGADETAMNAGPNNRSALARAMLTFSESSPAVGSVGIDPRLVDHLLGEPPSWRFPTLLCLAAAAASWPVSRQCVRYPVERAQTRWALLRPQQRLLRARVVLIS